ncbi:MAG: class IV adenylate cyclase [Treponema sp.]|jgi:adenylate cyclase class 2|nr:class IV adenylate cyclase [Treponema sp.]
MSIEIELKAWVDDSNGLKTRIDSLACFSGSFEKGDAYWHSVAPVPLPPSGVRIREAMYIDVAGRVTRHTWVTYKVKEVREGIEVNDEHEFEVSDKAAFEGLLRRFGLEPGVTKHKQGWAWQYAGITVELALVAGLGWFVELEILTDTGNEDIVADARTRLLTLLQQLGIPEEKIESRYYTEMLQALPLR